MAVISSIWWVLPEPDSCKSTTGSGKSRPAVVVQTDALPPTFAGGARRHHNVLEQRPG